MPLSHDAGMSGSGGLAPNLLTLTQMRKDLSQEESPNRLSRRSAAVLDAAPDSVPTHSVTLASLMSQDAPRMDDLPEYAPSQLSYHRCHAEMLAEMIATLPLQPGQRVLDLATGDGSCAVLLAERGAEVVALDFDEKYLAFAAQQAKRRDVTVRFMKGDAYALPFADGEFDAAFCAQSFYDLEYVPKVLHEMKRVVKGGGWIGIMENDSMHHVVLPWPADLEIKIRAAQLEAYKEMPGDAGRFYLGRRLVPLLKEAGLTQVEERSFSTQRRAPLTYDQRRFLQYHLTELCELVQGRLDHPHREHAEKLCNPADREFMLDQPEFSATILDFLVWGRLS